MPRITLAVVCATCGMKDPSYGCEAPSCAWRTEAIARAINSGAPYEIVCQREQQNSPDDIRRGFLNVSIVAYPRGVVAA